MFNILKIYLPKMKVNEKMAKKNSSGSKHTSGVLLILQEIENLKSFLERRVWYEQGFQVEPVADQIRDIKQRIPGTTNELIKIRHQLEEYAYALELYSPDGNKRSAAAYYLSQYASNHSERIINSLFIHESSEAIKIALKIARDRLNEEGK